MGIEIGGWVKIRGSSTTSGGSKGVAGRARCIRGHDADRGEVQR
jgi:hypothetical protein